MEAFLTSTFSVAVAEIGDKTQLLSLVLASRFVRQHWPIIAGIFVATLVNHALSAWLGDWLSGLVSAEVLRWVVAASFVAVGLWILIPDKEDDGDSPWFRFGAFGATLMLFFLAEIGDKTQVATVVLAARFDDMAWVVLGTTLGMLAANVPVVLAGEFSAERLPLAWIRRGTAVLFVVMGAWALLA